MSQLKKLVVASLLTVATITLNHGAASAQTMTCKEAVDLVKSRISSLQSYIFTARSSQLGWAAGDPTWLRRTQLRDNFRLGRKLYSEYPQCREAADRAQFLETINSAEYWLDGIEGRRR